MRKAVQAPTWQDAVKQVHCSVEDAGTLDVIHLDVVRY